MYAKLLISQTFFNIFCNAVHNLLSLNIVKSGATQLLILNPCFMPKLGVCCSRLYFVAL